MYFLDRLNIGHCQSVRKLIKKGKRHLPCVVSTCKYHHNIVWDKSRPIYDGEYCQGMIDRFEKIGGLGNKSTIVGCNNYVGCCAEQHAANALVLKNPTIGNRYSNIHFSHARRARTLEIIKPCKNCKKLFAL